MSDVPRLGILGGTFDPIHRGHVAIAEAARVLASLDRVLLIPAHVPPHRRTPPTASPYHRFAMVALALTDHEGLQASDAELHTAAPSYTDATLQRFTDDGYAPTQLFFITGADAFAEIASWHGYPALLDRAHFIVISRPGYAIDEISQQVPECRARIRDLGLAGDPAPDPQMLTVTSAGPVIFMMRASTPDISSREVRRRLSSGEPLGGLVAPRVEEYIQRHGLYRPSSDGR